MLTAATGDGVAALRLHTNSRAAAELSVNTAGAGDLTLYSPGGAYGLEAAGAPQSAPGRGGLITVYNKDGDQVAGMGTNDDGSGVLIVQEKGRALALLSRDATSQGGQLSLGDRDGKYGVEARGSIGKGGGILVSNSSGDPVASVETTTSGKGRVLVFETDHAAAELSAEQGDGELILILDVPGLLDPRAAGASRAATTEADALPSGPVRALFVDGQA